MTVFFRYYLYRLKKSLILFAVLSGALLVCELASGVDLIDSFIQIPVIFRDNRILFANHAIREILKFYFFAAAALSFILPVAVLSPFKKSRARDPFYALPLGARKKAAAHLLAGLTVYTALFVVFAPYHLLRDAGEIGKTGAAGGLFFAVFLEYLCGVGLYFINSFFFSFASTPFDGAVGIVLWHAVPYALGGFIRSLFYLFPDVTDGLVSFFGNRAEPKQFRLFYPLTQIYRNSAYSLSGIDRVLLPAPADPLFYGLFIGFSLAAAILFFILLPAYKTENNGSVSSSFMSYKTLIPLNGLLLVGGFRYGFRIPVTLILMLAGYVIYRRGFRLRAPDILWLCCAVALSAVLVFVLSQHPLKTL